MSSLVSSSDSLLCSAESSKTLGQVTSSHLVIEFESSDFNIRLPVQTYAQYVEQLLSRNGGMVRSNHTVSTLSRLIHTMIEYMERSHVMFVYV